MTKTFLAVVLAWGLAVAVTARAQTTPAPAAPAGVPPPPAASVAPAAPVEVPPPVAATIPIGTRVGMMPTNYEDGNRRDPFTSLIAAKAGYSSGPGVPAVPGLPGLALADVTVRGVVRSGENILAILEGPNQKSYVARPKDRLRDASVQTIDTTGVIFAEQLAPGMRPTTVRKTIRPAGEGIQ
jgi:hypothetical protein